MRSRIVWIELYSPVKLPFGAVPVVIVPECSRQGSMGLRRKVAELPVIGLGAEVVLVPHVDELNRNPDPIAGLPYASLQNRANIEFLPDFFDFLVSPPVSHCRSS